MQPSPLHEKQRREAYPREASRNQALLAEVNRKLVRRKVACTAERRTAHFQRPRPSPKSAPTGDVTATAGSPCTAAEALRPPGVHHPSGPCPTITSAVVHAPAVR